MRRSHPFSIPTPARAVKKPMTNPPHHHDPTCCAPAQPATAQPATPVVARSRRAAREQSGFVRLDGGVFAMGNHQGDGYPTDGETPVHEVILSPFRIATETVTNAQFAAFVAETGYITEAERFGWSFVFGGLLPRDFPPTRGAAAAPWWRQVHGAAWDHPEGPQSDLTGRRDHPVVHVSWHDAVAFCAWDGSRLPTEAEWEFAARGGRAESHFPWGDELQVGGKHRMNVWQGTFPEKNTGADGYLGTAPARSYQPNGFGLYCVTGNVWEWVNDWFSLTYYAESPRENPPGPEHGESRIMRGGSYLCHRSYCNRYRVDSRSANTPDSSAGNIGFRIARDA